MVVRPLAASFRNSSTLEVVRLKATTVYPWSFMFIIRFWPMTARPIKAISAVCSMICSKPVAARRGSSHYDLVGETLGEFRRASRNYGKSSTILDGRFFYNMWRRGGAMRGCVSVTVLGDTENAGAYPVGQTLGQTASFRQTAPETRCQSRVCGVSEPLPPRRLSTLGAGASHAGSFRRLLPELPGRASGRC